MSRKNFVCDVDDSFLIIIDVQTNLTTAMPVKVLARLQRYFNFMLKAAELLGVPVIATEQYPEGLGSLEPEIIGRLPENAVRIDKTCFSCVGNEKFLETIQESARKQIVITGMEAHMCVSQTAMDLIEKDYSVFVVMDAICSRRRENYENAIQRIGSAGGIITDAESVVFEWLRDANHKHYEYLSSLIH